MKNNLDYLIYKADSDLIFSDNLNHYKKKVK